MIDVYGRINEIMTRVSSINTRFSKSTAGNGEFSTSLADVQEKIYREKSYLKGVHRYDSIIEENARKYGVPVRLIKSVIKQESNFNPQAVSNKGAKGLMQLMPQTAGELGVKDAFSPDENIEGGVKYLRMMLNRFNGDVEKALAAYNAGPEAVERQNGIPAYAETKDYIKKVINNLEMF